MMKNLLTNNGVSIAIDKQEPCISHKSIAQSLGVDNRSMYRLIIEYQNDIEAFGIMRFQNAVIKGKGQPERIAYLNENQCYFVLTLTRNTAKAVQAKSALVMAFYKAREALTQRQTQYLPMYHNAHDSIKSVATMAHTNGSTTPEHIFHMTYEKLINQVFGIDAGTRDRLSVAQQCAISTAYTTIDHALDDATRQGLDHKQTYQLAKQRLNTIASAMGVKQIGVNQ